MIDKEHKLESFEEGTECVFYISEEKNQPLFSVTVNNYDDINVMQLRSPKATWGLKGNVFYEDGNERIHPQDPPDIS